MQQTLQKNYWQTFPTPQLLQILTALEDAKEKGTTKMLVGGTGVGKSYAIEKFKQQHPHNTYVITVSDVYKLEDILEELSDLIGLINNVGGYKVQMYRKRMQLVRIIDRLTEIKRSGGKPIVIFDEGENMNISVLKSIKALYDHLKDNCAIVLIGTGRLIDRMLNIKNTSGKRETLPELYSRFKAGLRHIKPVTPDQFTPFLDKYVADKALRKLICNTLESYRDLNTFLEPVMREAEERNEPLTANLYKLYHEINY